MDNKNQANSSNFYSQNGFTTDPRIQSLSLMLDQEEQPSFIRMTTLNGQTVAFLGNDPISEKDFYNNFYRVDRMVIPEFAQMVNPDVLMADLKKLKDGQYVKPHPGLFLQPPGFLQYDDSPGLQRNVLLEVCGMVSNYTYTDMDIHHCHNWLHSLEHTHNPSGGTCNLPHLTSYYDESSELRHKAVIFYVSKEGLQQTDNQPDGKQTWTIQERLQTYFADTNFEYGNNVVNFSADDLQGVFLIPMLTTDRCIVYYCVLNINGKSNRNLPVKLVLLDWLTKVHKYSSAPMDHEIYIEGNDSTFLYIEKWSVFLGRDAILHTANSDRIMKRSVLDRRIE